MQPKIYMQKIADKQEQAKDNTGKSPSVTFLTFSLRKSLSSVLIKWKLNQCVNVTESHACITCLQVKEFASAEEICAMGFLWDTFQTAEVGMKKNSLDGEPAL